MSGVEEWVHSPHYVIERRGVLAAPAAGVPNQELGVLNPASAHDRDGALWLFPRLVARRNWSVVGRGRVVVDDAGDPVGVEPFEVVFEPVEPWERNARTGGVEDPRITPIESLGVFVMTYAAYGPLGPRIGIAVSDDLGSWRRLGPAHFRYDTALGADLNLYRNKDAVWFPEPVSAPDGRRAYAMLHRPTWDLAEVSHLGYEAVPRGIDDPRPAIWVSFADAERVEFDIGALVELDQHREVAACRYPWEQLKIGAGTPPIRTAHGWLIVHHGVAGEFQPGVDHQQLLRYCAGVIVLDPADVTRVVYRSAEPLLEPDVDAEQEGIVPNVVFPTAIDVRDGHADVFYGMADSRIGLARLQAGGALTSATD